jgi:hypothetical protein
MEDLIQQILMYIIVSSVVVDGIKKTTKAIMKKNKDEKLHPLIGISLVYIFGMIAAFFLTGDIITGIPIRIFFGAIIGTVGISLYEAVLKSVRDLIPGICNRLLGSHK